MGTKIKLEDTFMDVIVKMSDGNPGAASVLARAGGSIDPQDFMPNGLGCMMRLDTLGIYGPDIWVLYKNVCGENLAQFLACVRAVQLGLMDKDELKAAVAYGTNGGMTTSIDLPGTLAAVEQRLERFNKGGTPE